MNDFGYLKDLKELSKCGNAYYCRYSEEDLYCIAEDEIVEECPYIRAIQEITALSVELTEVYEDNN